MAGKTGTTENNVDAWFVGYVPQVATAVWVGYDPPQPMTHVHDRSVTGGSFPAAIFGDLMRAGLADVPVRRLPVASPDALHLRRVGETPPPPPVAPVPAPPTEAVLPVPGEVLVVAPPEPTPVTEPPPSTSTTTTTTRGKPTTSTTAPPPSTTTTSPPATTTTTTKPAPSSTTTTTATATD